MENKAVDFVNRFGADEVQKIIDDAPVPDIEYLGVFFNEDHLCYFIQISSDTYLEYRSDGTHGDYNYSLDDIGRGVLSIKDLQETINNLAIG